MKTKISKVFVYIFAFFWVFMTGFPLVLTIMSSFRDNAGILLGMLSLPESWASAWEQGVGNYTAAVTHGHMGWAVMNSTLISLGTTVVVIVVAMLTAYVLARKKFRLRGILYSVFMLGVMVPIHVAIIPISGLASTLGGRDTYWFLILVYAAFNMSQAIFLFTGYLLGIDKEMDEAAIIDGCNDRQLLWRVLFPLSKPIISTVAIITFVFGYGELIFAMILIRESRMFTVARAMLAFRGGYHELLGPQFAGIVMAVIPMIIIYIIFHERIQGGMLAGAVKG